MVQNDSSDLYSFFFLLLCMCVSVENFHLLRRSFDFNFIFIYFSSSPVLRTQFFRFPCFSFSSSSSSSVSTWSGIYLWLLHIEHTFFFNFNLKRERNRCVRYIFMVFLVSCCGSPQNDMSYSLKRFTIKIIRWMDVFVFGYLLLFIFPWHSHGNCFYRTKKKIWSISAFCLKLKADIQNHIMQTTICIDDLFHSFFLLIFTWFFYQFNIKFDFKYRLFSSSESRKTWTVSLAWFSYFILFLFSAEKQIINKFIYRISAI